MAWAQAIYRVMLATALVGYAFDCEAMTTAEQAMQCCASMHCSRQGHLDASQGMDCCKTMPATHSPFVQATSEHGALPAAVVLFVLPPVDDLQSLTPSSRRIAALSHAPPVFPPPTLAPLRI